MRTCSKCNAQSPDAASVCVSCQAELSEFSYTAVALKRLVENPRVLNIRLVVAHECCPACREAEGTYDQRQGSHVAGHGLLACIGLPVFLRADAQRNLPVS